MKTLYLSILITFITTAVFSQWVPQSTGINNNLRGVFVLNETTGFAVGEAFPPGFAPILKTTDGGAHWVMKSSGTAYPLRDIAFNNNVKGFACGLYGTLLKSTDAGETWGTVDVATDAGFRAIDFPSKEVGYVAGEAGVFLKTSNVGVSWDSLNAGVPQDLLDIEFLNNDTGYATGSNGFSNGIILRTHDGGASWQTVYTSSQAIPAVAVTENNTIFAGGGTTPNGGHEFIVRSLDGGETWEEVFTGPAGHSIRRGTFITPIAGWFVDDAGAVIRTKNGGNTWSVSNVSTMGLNGVFFTDSDTGYAVGAQGSIFKYIPCSEPLIPLGEITGATDLCFGATNTYSVAPVAGANTYEWQVPSDASIVYTQGDTLVAVTFGSTSGNVTVTAGADCDTSIASLPVNVVPPLQAAGNITGMSDFCYGDTVIYSISTIQNALSYEWSAPSDALIISQNDTMIMVAMGSSAGMVTLQAADNCDTIQLSLPVFAHTSLPPISQISGDTAVCLNGLSAYQIPAVADAISYDWTLPAGATIVFSAGDTLVVIQFDSTAGNIGVTANGYCDSVSAILPVNIVGQYLQIDTLMGPSTACEGQPATYSIAPVPDAISYTWSVPADATILSGQGDTMLVVVFGATSGSIGIAAGKNNCDAAVASLFVNVTPSLQDPEDVIGVTSLCSGDSAEFIVSSVTGADSYSWQLPEGCTMIQNIGDTLIAVIFGDSSGYVTFSASSACETVSSSLYVNVHPGAPPINPIIGSTTVCSGDTATYTISSVEGVDYSWTIPFDAIIVASQGDTSITVKFGTLSDGILVIAGSACSLQDTMLAVNVVSLAALPGIDGDQLVCSGDTATYTIAAVEGLHYSWVFPDDANVISSSGDTVITLQFGSTSGVITVIAESACAAQDTSLEVVVQSFPPILSIIGDTIVCSGDTATYSIGSAAGVNYVWTIPSDAQVISSQGDTSITVQFGNSSDGIKVDAINACTTQDTMLAVMVVADDPIQGISGPAIICAGDTATYSIGAVAGTSHSWIIPADATIVSTSGDTAITIMFGSLSDVISVTSVGACTTQDTSLAVTVVANPPVPVITFVDNNLISSEPAGNQWYYYGSVIAGATGQTYTPTQNGTYSVSVTYPPGCTTSSDTFAVISVSAALPAIPHNAIISPNPFETFATLSLVHNYQLHNCSLVIQDIQGKVVRTMDHLYGSSIRIFRNTLPEGIYYFRLSDEQQLLITTGKLIIQ